MTLNSIPHFDLSVFPNLSKSAIGFDTVLKRLRDISDDMPKIPTYPPYNIRKISENKYVIEMAVAGFGKQDLEIEIQDDTLTIKGQTAVDSETVEYIFKGIADRSFTRKFTLADSVQIQNAELINGLLKISLERFIPEEKKPRKINILDPFGVVETTKQFLTEASKK